LTAPTPTLKAEYPDLHGVLELRDIDRPAGDGSAVFSVSGVVWGQDRLQIIANHLGVPLEW
jgi:hypothetical protein